MVLRKVVSVFALVAASLFGVASANAKAFYVAGNSARTSGGTSCSNALSVAWFNNASSWGSGSNQISAGTTVFLCGVFTGRPGEQLLTLHGSGTAASPITIKFLTGAVLTAPYWGGGGAIHMDGLSHIIVDGGTNGTIQNTANGTGRAYRQSSIAVHAANCTSCTVQNLIIQNLYVRTSASDLAPSHSINCVYWLNSNNLTINHITCHDASWAIAGNGNNFTLENSDIYHVDHGLATGVTGTMGNYSIHNNHFHDFANWDSPTNTYHHDGIHIWGQGGAKFSGGAIYNNTFDGDFGVNVTGHIFLQDSVSHVAVYNNVFSTPTNRTINSLWFAASSTSLPGGPATGNSAYNNSINAGGHHSGAALFVASQLSFTAVNNVLAGGSSNITIQGGGTRSSTGINNNVYRDLFAEFGDLNTFGFQGHTYYVLSLWRAACGCDGASKLITGAQTTAFSSVNLAAPVTAAGASVTASTDGVGASDPASADAVNMAVISTPTTKEPDLELLYTVGEGNGLNLSDLAVDDLAPLALSMNGSARPASGPWNVGPF
jgi:hypothetical protein